VRRILLDLCSDFEFSDETASLVADPTEGPATAIPLLQRLVQARVLDRIAARVAYLIAAGELDPRDLKETLPPRPLRARPASGARTERPQEQPPTLEAGQRIGRSVIEGLLCSGPHGAVYRATHAGLGCPVVVKIAGQAEAAEQLRTETTTLSEITHRNVVRLWDAGTHGEFPFITTEYLARGSLKDELARRGPLPASEVLGVAFDAARGLRAVLASGFVHGDVKPGNLLLAADGTVKVADFGTARRVNAEGIVAGEVLRGSWPYLAPERFGESSDHRGDIYSLGLTIYHLLTGVPPVVASTPRECLRLHRELALEPLHWTVAGVSRDASVLFLKMAARDPDARPATYDELLADLTRLRDQPAASDTDRQEYAP